MSFPISAPPLEPPIRGHFYWALKGTLSLGYNSWAIETIEPVASWARPFYAQRMRAFLATVVALIFCATAQAFDVCRSVPVYEPCEIEFEMTEAEVGEHPNPYMSVELRAEFRSPKGGRTKVIPGFWDGGRRFKIRFSPLDEGRWDFRIISNLPSVARKTGAFEASAHRTPGFVRIFNTRYFRYDAPESAHFWMGDTCYTLATIPWRTFQGLIDVRAGQKFNHLRGLVLSDKKNAAELFADPDRIRPEYFQEVDRRVAYMNSKGITYDLILGDDENQLAVLLPARRQRERYVRYLVARYAAMNITWQGVEKYEEYEDGRKFLREVNTYIERLDPYKHPRSTHTVTTSSPLLGDGWMDYVTQRSSDGSFQTVEFAIFPVPFVNAAVAAEAHGARAPGSRHVDSDTMRRRTWNAAVRGQYPTFANSGTYGGEGNQVELRYADSPAARQMAHLYKFFEQTRYWDLLPYFRVEGGAALSLEVYPYRSDTPRGVEYIVYVEKPAPIELLVPRGKYDVSWFNPLDGSWLDQKEKFKGERFRAAGPPDDAHDWVLYVRREGKKQSMNRSYVLESRRPPIKKVETAESETPFEIQLPADAELVVGRAFDFNATLTKEGRVAKKMQWLWTFEVSGSRLGPRVLGTKQFGRAAIPPKMARRYPATLQLRLLGVDGNGRVFEAFRAYQLVKERLPD